MDYIAPPGLFPADTIGLICPASPPNTPEKISQGAAYLERHGFKVRLGKHVHAQYGYLAGSDQERLGDLNEMIRDDEVKAIFAVRGGYGSPRLLRGVDYDCLKRNPKIISGFSDITGLQLAIAAQCRLITFSGAMPGVEFWKNPTDYTQDSFWKIFRREQTPFTLPNHEKDTVQVGKPGVAEGVLMGGNLALFAANLGTPYMPDLQGAILVFEDVDEFPYRVDRMLTQLRNAGVFEQIAGLVLGKFTHCVPKQPELPHLSIEQVLQDAVDMCPCPSILNLSYGHVANKMTLPLGCRVRLDTSFHGLSVLSDPVSWNDAQINSRT
ncbi:MAG: S66 peptidase family protein [Verrucomicrobiales bacterium]